MSRQRVTPPDAPSQTVDMAGYMRAYRKSRPDIYRREVKATSARVAAALRVAKQHPGEFEAAIADERAKRGLS